MEGSGWSVTTMREVGGEVALIEEVALSMAGDAVGLRVLSSIEGRPVPAPSSMTG